MMMMTGPCCSTEATEPSDAGLSINQLPAPVLVHIFSYLDRIADRCRAAMVCSLWYQLAHENCLWKRLDLCAEQFHFRSSLTLFIRTYLGSSLLQLDLKKIDNTILQHLKTSCTSLQKLILFEGKYQHCNFELLPASLTFLEILTNKREHYPPRWFVSFTPDHFPHLKTLKLQKASRCDAAIRQIVHLKSLRNLELTLLQEPSADAFSVLMQMTDLETLGLVDMDSLPDDYANQIVCNLRKLKQINLIRSEHYVRPMDVKMLAQLPNLEKLMIPSTLGQNIFAQDILKAVIEVMPSMLKLKEVEFDDDDWPSDDQAPKDLLQLLKTMKELRPDVFILFRDVEVCKENYDFFQSFLTEELTDDEPI